MAAHGLCNWFMMQLVSESVKTKQAQSFLISEKQTSMKQLQQVNALVESLKSRILHSEEQVNFLYTLLFGYPVSLLSFSTDVKSFR